MIEIVIIEQVGMDKKTKIRVQERRERNLCISCGDTDKKVHKRECCIACHGRYILNQPKGKKNRQIYEAEAISAGLIGPSRQGQRLKSNPYKELADKVEAS